MKAKNTIVKPAEEPSVMREASAAYVVAADPAAIEQ